LGTEGTKYNSIIPVFTTDIAIASVKSSISSNYKATFAMQEEVIISSK